MANVLDLRRRIRSVRNTRQITKAMKMVSAAKLRRAQDRAVSARPYAAMLASVLESLKRRAEIYDPETGECRHPLLLTRAEKRILLIVVSGDKGFAGAFNTNIFKAAAGFVLENDGKQIDIEAIGRKGRDLFRRRYPAAQFSEPAEEGRRPDRQQRTSPIEVLSGPSAPLDRLNYDSIRDVADEIISLYAREEIDAAYLVYNEFKSVIQQRVVVERVLPILSLRVQEVERAQEPSLEERERAAEAALSAGVSLYPHEAEAAQKQFEDEVKNFGTAEVDYIYEQPPAEIFADVLPRYVTSQLYHALLESIAAEHAARMTAMDSATNNASEMIDSLTLTMNRVRQAAITKEIIEIVSGAAAI
ncbi:MAG TPA: FoF1 ATP synthase subunit gamma [Acidobacteriaceae bacterium]|jgi:F-type H+-transporting ATPase subunit gamma|nr:FoF1 ATP synthase subunit gamma [Acidobacteriaceae bacterium]